MKVTLYMKDGRMIETSSVSCIADGIKRGALRLIQSKDEAKVWYNPSEISAIAIEPDPAAPAKPDPFLGEETEKRLMELCGKCAIRGKDDMLCAHCAKFIAGRWMLVNYRSEGEERADGA